MNRRAFMHRFVKTGLSIVAAGALGYGLHDPKGPDGNKSNLKSVVFPDFSRPDLQDKLCVARGADRRITIRSVIKAMGGMEKFIGKGERVLLKVNAAFASPPSLCATSHPDLVSETVALCYEAGASDVLVTDNPINDPASCFALTGIENAAKKMGARIILPRHQMFRRFTLPGGRLIKSWPVLYTPFEQVDRVIGLAPVKDHKRSGASMVLKNWYGLLGGRRNIFHQEIHTIIQELSMMIRPTLVILDGTQTMMTNGPTGGSLSDLKPTHTMVVSTDPVAADTYGAFLLDRQVRDLPYISLAEQKGVGTSDLTAINRIDV